MSESLYMNEPNMVIIGAGQAGGRAALALREQGWDGGITLVGGEACAPYERPPLSKAFLAGEADAAAITIADAAALDAAGVDFRAGRRVTALDRDAREVHLDDGTRLGYRGALIATGRRPRRLDVPGAALGGIHYLRDVDDARGLAPELRSGQRLVVIGGGFIGLEVAATAVERGADVTVLEVGPRLLMRAVPEAMAEVLAERHHRAGVALRCDARVAGFDGGGHVTDVVLADGSRVPADAVVVGVGATPRDELAREAGLTVDGGIVVDETLATDDPAIFAAGDVCAFPHPLGGGLLRLEAWQNADDQGAHAARNLLGAAEPYRAVPWFWSTQYELTLQMAGYPERGVQTVERPVGDGARLHFHLDGDSRVIGVSAVGTTAIARDARIGQKLIERGAPVPADTLADPAARLKPLLKAAAA